MAVARCRVSERAAVPAHHRQVAYAGEHGGYRPELSVFIVHATGVFPQQSCLGPRARQSVQLAVR